MKAVQITAPSEMRVVDVEKPAVGAGEVLVKIKYGLVKVLKLR